MNALSLENWNGIPDCIRLSNGTVDVVVSTAFGPRVLHYGFTGSDNVLGSHPQLSTNTPWGPWRPRGGHRLWAAPEALPGSYAPDDAPVTAHRDGAHTVRLIQPTDRAGLRKELTVALAPHGTQVTLRHTLVNETPWTIELAPWALTILRGGGIAIVPHEPFRSHDEDLLPARSLVLWPFTNMADPRWTWGARLVLLRADPAQRSPQKVGASNRVGWCAYHIDRTLFLKRFQYQPDARYPDHGANCELYTEGDFIELESLGPLVQLEPGASTREHVEEWMLVKDVALPLPAELPTLQMIAHALSQKSP